ncbi:site-specific tyrosine recombinase XerC [Gallibacterium salpingitidis]|uniref:Site-specific tyrosine recombinase XerC n=1 Tax=Gallibacterium salpingitidis TaxID=505341 RepID=A0AB36E2I2_9PAST|nr:tyrosine-type recombinase/integrase [Gallibacterium salpingitidis]OBX04201.1 site-specific tyrosine recombinase XerC [Gallibacterium salpingitidis]OBX10425.1 site-specific tyrosine recombinase XerC [Gallibacterium salpingitidis]
MRLPNGYGSVVKLSGSRRKPYVARKTVGYNEKKKQIYNVIGYYATRDEALTALANYNQQDKPEPSVTLAKVYQLWYPIHTKQVSIATASSYQNSYNHLATISAMPINKIKYRHLQTVLDTMREKGLSYASLKKVRSLINQLFSYAIINEWVDKSYGQYLQMGKNTPKNPHKIFSRQQINRVWQCTTVNTDLTLILLYTGMRVSELLQLKRSCVNLKQKYFDIVTAKTKAGIRIIPIHPRILPIIERKMHENKRAKYLFVNQDLTALIYSQAASQFARVMRAIRAKHSTHDCRHTVATLLDAAGANKVARDKLLGHASSNVGDAVYTHKTLIHLRKTINLLK